MAYDFSNVRSIIKSDGTELQKITDANGDIIWQKLYVWEKFNCNKEVSEYQKARGSTTLTYPTSGHIYKTLNYVKQKSTKLPERINVSIIIVEVFFPKQTLFFRTDLYLQKN